MLRVTLNYYLPDVFYGKYVDDTVEDWGGVTQDEADEFDTVW